MGPSLALAGGRVGQPDLPRAAPAGDDGRPGRVAGDRILEEPELIVAPAEIGPVLRERRDVDEAIEPPGRGASRFRRSF